MILMVGGACQGKTRLALEKLGAQPQDVVGEDTGWQGTGWVIVHLERFILRELEQNPQEKVRELFSRVQPEMVLADEIGCGLVPVDAKERAWREMTGRILCEIAREADSVVRVHCGIPQAIKGEW